MNNSKLKIFIFLILAFSFTLLVFSLWRRQDVQASPLDEFARCLRDKNVVMYGAEWCPHCQNQKKMFGDAFKFINYVECPKDPQRCLAVGINGYPTWVMPNGGKLVGEQKLETLSQKTNCPLPIEAKPQ